MYKMVLNDMPMELATEARVIEYAKNRLVANPFETPQYLTFERAKHYIGEIVGEDFDNYVFTKNKDITPENYKEWLMDLEDQENPPFIYELFADMAKEVGNYLDIANAISDFSVNFSNLENCSIC